MDSSCIWSCSTEGRKKTLIDFKVYKIRLVVCVFIKLIILTKKKQTEKKKGFNTDDKMEVMNWTVFIKCLSMKI